VVWGMCEGCVRGVGCVGCVGCVVCVGVWAVWGLNEQSRPTPYVRHSPDCTCCDTYDFIRDIYVS
jgi:hypothetical protein